MQPNSANQLNSADVKPAPAPEVISAPPDLLGSPANAAQAPNASAAVPAPIVQAASLAPSPVVQAVAPPGNVTTTTSELVGQGAAKFTDKLRKAGFAASAVVLVGAGIVMFLVSRQPVSKWDVLAASNSASELSSDITDMNSDIKSMDSATVLSDFNSASGALNSQSADADTQYNLLLTSPVLKNAGVKQKFAAVGSKWSAYDTFVGGTAADLKVLGPLLISLSNSQQALLAISRQKSSSLAANIAQYQALVTSTGNQAAGLNMRTDPGNQLLDALKLYVKNSDAAIAQLQTDVAGNKGENVISVDITAVAAAATVFSNAQDTLTTSTQADITELDPSAQVSALRSSLENLSNNLN